MGKKSDKKEKKVGKKHDKEKSAKKSKASDNVRVIKDYLTERSVNGEIRLDMESRFHVNFNMQEARIKKSDRTYTVRIGMPKDETLLLVSVAIYANEMLQADYAELNQILMSKVKYRPEKSMVECCIVMLLDNMLSEKQLNWSVHKLIMDCDYSGFYSSIHAKPKETEETEEPYPEDEDEASVSPQADAADILDHLMSAAGKTESEPQTEAASAPPSEPDGTVSAAEDQESMSILSKLLNGALSAAEPQPAPEAEIEPKSESGNSDKKKGDSFVSVSKADMLEALFGKKGGEKKSDAEASPKKPDEEGDKPDDADTPPDDTDDTDGSDGE